MGYTSASGLWQADLGQACDLFGGFELLADHLRSLGHADAADATEDIAKLIRATGARYDTLRARLQNVWHEAGWHLEGQGPHNEASVAAAVEAWRALPPAPAPADHLQAHIEALTRCENLARDAAAAARAARHEIEKARAAYGAPSAPPTEG